MDVRDDDVVRSIADQKNGDLVNGFATMLQRRVRRMQLVTRGAVIIAAALLRDSTARLAPALGSRARLDGARFPPVACMTRGANARMCLTLDGSDDEVLDLLIGCEWVTKDPARLFEFWMVYDIVVNGTPMAGPLPYDDITRDFLRRPSPPTSTCTRGLWRMMRIGPFHTFGGTLWPSILGLMRTPSPWLPPPRPDGTFAFGSYVFGSTDEQGRLLGYPPIHQHHFHFGYAFANPMLGPKPWNAHLRQRGVPSPALPPESMAIHGENQCARDEGGVLCYVHSAPEGYAYLERSPLGFTNSFNDVRPTRSVMFRSWQIAALKLHSATTSRVRAVHLRYAMLVIPPMESRYTYLLHTDHDAVAWTDGAWTHPCSVDADVEVVDAYMHAHADHIRDVWLFDGRIEDVLDVPEVLPRATLVYTVDVIAFTMNAIRRRQLRSPRAATLTCSYATNSVAEYDPVTSARYQRKVRCPVDRLDRPFVLLVLHHTPRAGSAPRATVRMHAYVKVYSVCRPAPTNEIPPPYQPPPNQSDTLP